MAMKKNMAVIMAGAMVATTAMPAFAAQASDQKQTTFTVDANNQAQLVGKVGELLNTNYTSVLDTKTSAPTAATANDKVYEITVGSGDAVTNKTDFKNQLAEALKDNTLAVVTVKDNGHETVGDAVNNYTTSKYTLKTLNNVETQATTAACAAIKTTETKGSQVVVTLTNGTTITLGVGSDVLNFTKPVDKDGKEVTDVANNTDKVVGFAKEYVAVNPETYTVNVTSTKMEETTVDKLYDGVFLTAEGQALVDSATSGNTLHAYENKTTAGTLESLNIVLANTTTGAQVQELANGQISRTTVTGDAEQLKGLEAIINNPNSVNTPIKIAGDNRYETAAMISKDLRTSGSTVEPKDQIVIASAESLVDGLAAGPLAAQLNTSILLANKNEAPEATMAELKAALNIENTEVGKLKTKTVYIVGGDAVVGQSVVDQLENLGVTVKRLAGDNRNETSIAVANEMAKLNTTKTPANMTKGFVVGATGIADAMSISSYAAQTKSPIIVSGFNSEVNADTLALTKGMNLTIIGGDGVVSNELQAQLDENNGNTNKVERVKGNDRFQTNAAVINKFFNDSDSTNDATKVFVAADGYKAGNDKLVDALTAAPLAAQSKAPIVLATEELDKDQVEALQLVDTTANAKVVQVGGGILSSVIAKVMSILG